MGGSETRASVVVVKGQPQTKLVGPAPCGRGVTLMPLPSHTGEKVSWNIFAFMPRSMREMPRGGRALSRARRPQSGNSVQKASRGGIRSTRHRTTIGKKVERRWAEVVWMYSRTTAERRLSRSNTGPISHGLGHLYSELFISNNIYKLYM